MQKIIIGSRGSDLALWQANFVKSQLENLGAEVEIKIIVTQGDAIQHLSFDKLEGKGFFTKEIEDALLRNEIDLAVHSHKDLETNPPAGLKIAAVSQREDPSDMLLILKSSVDKTQKWNIKKNAVIGTSSARRKAQVVQFRPDCKLKDLRGNVPTRIQKLRDKQYDGILLASAGVERLEIDLSEFEVHKMDIHAFVPAPAQGVLGLQIREEDDKLYDFLQQINNSEVENRIYLERKVLNLMDGGCQLALGVFSDDHHNLYVSYAKDWQEGAKTYHFSKDASSPEEIVDILNAQ